MNLAAIAAEMRALGIKSLALELADAPSLPPNETIAGRPTLAPGDTPPPESEPKRPEQCAFPGCGEDKRGLFGAVASEFCRTHALQKAGVKT